MVGDRQDQASLSPKTVNLEVGTLRAILRRHKHWSHLQQDVRVLPVNDNIGRALDELEEKALLEACLQSRSRSLYPAVVLALSTCMRYSEIRLLRWEQIDVSAGCITVGKSKTEHGTGRTIPLNARALAAMKMWATQFPARDPEHFVFPSEKYGAATNNFTAFVYATNPTEPIHSWKVGWEAAKGRAAKILMQGKDGCATQRGLKQQANPKAKEEIIPLQCRFHDLRHTGCTRMLEGGVPYPVVASLMGWSASTAIRMARRYDHIGQKAYREAVGLLNGAGAQPSSRTRAERTGKAVMRPN